MLFERIDLREVSRAVGSLGVDGWLIYDFHGANPVAKRVVGYGGMATRRLFVWIPASGEPVALVHRIEMQPMEGFPGVIVPYSTWAELGSALGKVISGKRAAMEISPADAVPYLDRVPFGVVDLIRGLGAEVVESSDLVSRFAARWSAQELEDHLAAAEILASVARSNIRFAQQRVGSITEHELQARVIAELEQNGLKVADPPIVGFGPNSALPHYEPSAANSVALGADEVILLDLWAGKSLETVFADQTWMGFSGAT
ncbi:MAG: M24 family metallopeptidase, partial [Gemmatimonadales bacterium]